MKIGVVGARDRFDKEWIFKRLDEFIKKEDTVISGGASGVDSYAEEYAKLHSLNFHEFPPLDEDDAYGKRNTRIAEASDVVLAFPSKNSIGTWDTVRTAIRLNQRVVIYEFEKEKHTDE